MDNNDHLLISESTLSALNETADREESAHDTLTLLMTGEKLKVPQTQTHSPMTEDMQVVISYYQSLICDWGF